MLQQIEYKSLGGGKRIQHDLLKLDSRKIRENVKVYHPLLQTLKLVNCGKTQLV